MALGKTIKTNTGANAEYWKITYFETVCNGTMDIRGRIDGFLDQTESDAGSEAMESYQFEYHDDKESNINLAQLYTKVKTLVADLSDATDN